MQTELKIEIGDVPLRKEVYFLAKILAEKLQMLGPSDSAVCLKVNRGDSSCTIESPKVEFSGKSSERDPQSALADLDHQMMVQITAWKASRFPEKSVSLW